jgi:hypothetical protein
MDQVLHGSGKTEQFQVDSSCTLISNCVLEPVKSYTEQEMLNFARRMILEYLLGNTLLLTEEDAVRAKLPPATPADL